VRAENQAKHLRSCFGPAVHAMTIKLFRGPEKLVSAKVASGNLRSIHVGPAGGRIVPTRFHRDYRSNFYLINKIHANRLHIEWACSNVIATAIIRRSKTPFEDGTHPVAEHVDIHMNRKECDLKDDRSAVCGWKSIEPDLAPSVFACELFLCCYSIIV
jgi:hypothetical protein